MVVVVTIMKVSRQRLAVTPPSPLNKRWLLVDGIRYKGRAVVADRVVVDAVTLEPMGAVDIVYLALFYGCYGTVLASASSQTKTQLVI